MKNFYLFWSLASVVFGLLALGIVVKELLKVISWKKNIPLALTKIDKFGESLEEDKEPYPAVVGSSTKNIFRGTDKSGSSKFTEGEATFRGKVSEPLA